MDCQGHGTHVTGIIAAEALNIGAPYPFVGVSPNVTLGIWKVFGCTGGATDDVLIHGLVLAFEAGVDIISMSIGGAEGWPEHPTAVVASRIARQGVFVSIAAGNDGQQGLLYASSPAAGLDVNAAASVESTDFFAWIATVAHEDKEIVSH